MIVLPPLTIERDDRAEVELFLAVKTWLERDQRLEGIHASDLLDPRQAYWSFVEPKEMTERQVWLYAIGKVLHMLVIAAMKGGLASDEGTRSELGILFSPDILREDRPIELKTHRGIREPAPNRIQEEFQHYLEQLSIYLVLTNRLVGQLWVLFISLQNQQGKTYPEPRCYTVSMTEEQFYEIERQILEARDALQEARDEKDPHALPLCRAWKCGPQACLWWTSCQPPGRYPERDRRHWRV